MRIAIGADHAGFDLKQVLAAYLRHHGHAVIDKGTENEEPVDYPDYAEAVAKSLLAGEAERGLIICGSGVLLKRGFLRPLLMPASIGSTIVCCGIRLMRRC